MRNALNAFISGAVRAWLAGLLLAAALAARPAANVQAQSGEGTPILVVESYSTTPNPIASGQRFTLNVTLKNVGTKHAEQIMAAVAGGSQFVQLGPDAVVGQLDPGASGSFSLEVQAGSLGSGAYDLGLDFRYRIGTSGEQRTSRSVGVSVAASGGVSGKPSVVIEAATPRSLPLAVGEAFDVDVVLRNAGTRKAFGVTATLKLNEYLSPEQGSGSGLLGDLEAGQAVTLTLRLVLEKISPTGRVAQTFSLEYRDSGSQTHTSDETASLDLGAAGRRNPQLMVSAHTTQPLNPAPGDTFTLSVTVANVGAGAARRVLVRLGDDEGLKPFVPLGASNVAYAGEIAPGSSVQLTQTLLMDGSAAGGAYPLKVTLAYENEAGESQTETELIGLLTMTRPQVKVDLSKELPDVVRPGQSFDISVDVINIGRQRIEVSVIEVLSDQLDMTRNSLYVGPLDASISGGLTARATARQAGTAVVRILIHYRDDLNQIQTLEETLSLEVMAGSAPAPESADTAASTAGGGLWQMLLQFFGLGG